MNNQKRQSWFPLIIALAIVGGMFMGFKLKSAMPGRNFFSVEKASSLDEILSLIKNKYVDEVNMDAISDSAINVVLAQLDPHSVYIPAEQLQSINDDIKGSFFGIGVEYEMINDTLNVINVLEDGPAEKAGIKTGDKMLKAGDSSLVIKKIKPETIRRLLTGELGSEIKVNFMRGKDLKTVTIKRGIIPIKSVDAAYMIADKTGYIRLNRFSTQTYNEFMTSLLQLKKEGMQKLILDLRDNGGGVLDEAVEVADELLAGDKLITYTEGKHSPKKEYRCRRQGQFEEGQLVVLCNENSASASEILLGALQDWDRATIIGRTTFGKGLVQDQYSLQDHGALRLTIARYYTPLGRSIQRSYKNGSQAYYASAIKRMEKSKSAAADSILYDSSHLFRTAKGKILFGSGGINPDIFVRADTSQIGAATAKLFVKGIINNYGYRYLLQNPALITQYKKPSGFVQDFLFKEDNWVLFQAMAMKDSIDISRISPAEKTFLQQQLKISLSRQLFRNEGYFEAANKNDAVINKALQVLGEK